VRCLPIPIFGAERTAVADDGHAIRLILFRGAEALGTAMLDPVRTVESASELIVVAYRRLTG
jgi:hypothetical protein